MEKAFNGKFYMSNANKAKGGVAIVISDELDYEFMEMLSDKEGRIILIKIKLLKETVIVGSVYFPTKNDQKGQLETLNILVDLLVKLDGTSVILGGDFNIALDP